MPQRTPIAILRRRCVIPLRHAGRRCRHGMARAVHGLEARTPPVAERPALCLSAGLLGGSLLGVSLRLSPGLIAAILLAAGVLARRWPVPALQRGSRLVFAGLLLAHLQVWWQAQALPEDHIARFLAAHAARPVTVEGRIYRAVENRGERQRLYLQLHRLQLQQGWQRLSGRIRLNVQATDLPFLPGDVVRVKRLRLHAARGFLNPGGFDFRRFMHRQGIYALGGVSSPARLRLVQRPDDFIPARTLARWRRLLQSRVRLYLPSPYDGVFLAMILGHQGALTPTVQHHFRAAGTAHLLVVSGLHVGFVAAGFLLVWRFLLRLLRSRLPRSWVPDWRPTPLAVLLSLPAVALYCSLVGWKIPTTRAAVMVGSSMLALALGRRRELPYALVLAAMVILLFDPKAIFTLGFQLSFAAVTAILLSSRGLLEHSQEPNRYRRWGRRFAAYVRVSAAAYLGTLPILAGAFRTLPTFGILANVLLVPLAALLIPAGVAALGLLAVWPALGALVCPLFVPPLAWIVTLTGSLAALPHAQVHLAAPSVPMLLGYYGILASIMLPVRKPWRLPGIAACATLLLAGFTWQSIATRVGQLHVTFVDVGSGDAIFVQAPGNHYLLVDGGGTYDGRFDIGTQVIAPLLWDRHVHGFELMAMTHPQANHARGLVSLLQLFPAAHLLTNGTPLTAHYLRPLLPAARRWGTQLHTAPDGPRQWQWGRLRLTVLSPPSLAAQRHTAWNPPTENDRSLVLRLQYGAVRILLTGDIQHAAERWLLSRAADLRADILQVPHHGSKTSTSTAFVRRVRPHIGIISSGAGNPYGHPHSRVIQVLESLQVRTFRTDLHGAITITSDGTRYQVTPFHRR